MKKILLLLILILNFTNIEAQRHVVGFNSGFIFSKIRVSKDDYKIFDSIKHNVSIYYNLNYERYISSNISAEIGISYEEKGFSDNISLLDLEGNTIRKLDMDNKYKYLSFPISIKYTYGNKFKISLQVGSSSGYLINGELSFSEDVKFDNDITDRINRFDLALFSNLAFSYTVYKNIDIVLSGRLNGSLLSVTTEKYYNGFDFYNYYYGFTIGVKYYI